MCRGWAPGSRLLGALELLTVVTQVPPTGGPDLLKMSVGVPSTGDQVLLTMGARAQPPWAVDLLEKDGWAPPARDPCIYQCRASGGPPTRGTLNLLEMNSWSRPLGTSCPVLHPASLFPLKIGVWSPGSGDELPQGLRSRFPEQTARGIGVSGWTWAPGTCRTNIS